MIIFAKAGDTFHPDLTRMLTAAAGADGIVWDLALQGSSDLARDIIRRPVTLGAAAVAGGIGTVGFAVQARHLDSSLAGVVRPDLAAQIAAGAGAKSRWVYLPSALSSTRCAGSPSRAVTDWAKGRPDFTQAVEKVAPTFEVLASAPMVVVAPRLQDSIGLVLSAPSGEQARKMLSSFAKQRLKKPPLIAVTVTDDGPGAQEVADAAAEFLPDAKVRVIDCGRDGSEARRFNLAASAIDCETLLFVRSGVRLEHPDGLQAMAAWARTDGAAAVTCRTVWEDVLSEPLGAEPRVGLRSGLPADRFSCVAISRRSWQIVGEFDDLAFPSLFDLEWRLRAQTLGLQSLHLNAIQARAAQRLAPPSLSERLILQGLFPPAGFGAATGEMDAAWMSQRSDERAKALAGKLLAVRRAAQQSKQDLLAEVAELGLLAADLQRSVNALSAKLDRD